MSRTKVRLALVATGIAAALLLSGCDALFNPLNPKDTAATPTGSPVPTATCNTSPYESVFSAYGSLHYTRLLAPNLTLILDMYTDQKTHEWLTTTADKHLSFVVKVIDSNAAEKDPFKDKRKVYMSQIDIDANTVTKGGQTESIFSQHLDPIEATLDPEAEKSKYGLLITSPKGGFQRENNQLTAPTMPDTIGFNMNFVMTISSQTNLGDKNYNTRLYTVQLPVTLFTPATENTVTSCATSATLVPVPLNAN